MFSDLVKKSRSKRSFLPDASITEDTLLELCDLARFCPAAMNLQALKYRLVTQEQEVSSLLAHTRWASSLPGIKLPPEGHGPSAFLVLCHDTALAPQKPIFLIDAGIAAQTIMLAAAERGLGGCIIGSAAEEVVSELLELPDGIKPVLLLGLGVPNEEVVLTEATDGDVRYYRDETNTHYVPKRPLSEIILRKP